MNLVLARKDVRIYRPAIVAAVLLAMFLEVVLPALGAYIEYRYLYARGAVWIAPGALARIVWQAVGNGATAALMLTTGLAAVFGGTAITIERRERWGEFAAMLPISRRRRTLVSLATGAALFATCWLFHLALLVVAVSHTAGASDLESRPIATVACFGLGTFGLAWLLSSFLRSATIVASVTVGVVLGGLFVVWALDGLLPATDPLDPTRATSGWNPGRFVPTYAAMLVVLGLIGCVLGTFLSSRRVEP